MSARPRISGRRRKGRKRNSEEKLRMLQIGPLKHCKKCSLRGQTHEQNVKLELVRVPKDTRDEAASHEMEEQQFQLTNLRPIHSIASWEPVIPNAFHFSKTGLKSHFLKVYINPESPKHIII